jgi:hypothetical protein
MTSTTGKQKKHKRKFQYLNKAGARGQRREFMDTHYVKGIVNDFGEQSMRPLDPAELEWLNQFYKEEVHGTFNTDEESKLLFKTAKHLTTSRDNVKFFEKNGFHTEEVQEAISKFEAKSKSLGNIVYKFFDQRNINSDDYKRRHDVQNKASREYRMDSFEDMQYMENVEDKEETFLEDLITQSEK